MIEKGHNTGNGSAVVSITGVTEGATLVLAWTQSPTDTRIYTASSNVDGAMTPVVTYAPQRRQGQFRLDNATAGDHTITLQANAGTTQCFAWVFEEPDGLTATVVIPTGDGNTSSSGNTHTCAASGEVDSAATGALAIVCCGTLTGTVSSVSAGTSPAYTAGTTASNARNFCQFRNVANGPVADDAGTYTHSGGATTAQSTMVIYEVATPGAAPASYVVGGGWFG